MDKKIIINENQLKKLSEHINPNYDLTVMKYYGLIDEGLIKTYPIDDTINFVNKMLGVPFESFRVLNCQNNRNSIKVIVSNDIDDESVNKLNRAFNTCGYFFSLKLNEYENAHSLIFEPKYDKDVYDRVMKNKFLIHITFEKYVDKIMKIGLSPRTHNKFWKYPDRVYLISTNDLNDVNNIGVALAANNESICLVLLNKDNLHNNIKFYDDPNAKNGIFTYDNIPPNAIHNIIKLDVNKMREML